MDRTKHQTEGVDRGRLTLHSFRQSEPSIPQNQAIRSAATAVADATAAHGGLSARAGSAEFSAFIEAQRQAFLEWATRSGMILDAGQTQAWFANNLLSVQSSEHIVAYENGLRIRSMFRRADADSGLQGGAASIDLLAETVLSAQAHGFRLLFTKAGADAGETAPKLDLDERGSETMA